MKYGKYPVNCATVLILLPLAFAKVKDRTNITLSQTVMIGQAQVKPGDYQLRWTGTGNNVEVNILQAGKTVGTAQAKLVENATRSPYNSVSVTTEPHSRPSRSGFRPSEGSAGFPLPGSEE